jgi:hypothetical protein
MDFPEGEQPKSPVGAGNDRKLLSNPEFITAKRSPVPNPEIQNYPIPSNQFCG